MAYVTLNPNQIYNMYHIRSIRNIRIRSNIQEPDERCVRALVGLKNTLHRILTLQIQYNNRMMHNARAMINRGNEQILISSQRRLLNCQRQCHRACKRIQPAIDALRGRGYR